MLPVIFREVFGRPEFPREPEPDLVMDDENQVKAYEEAGRIDGVMSASYLFQGARISQVIQENQKIIDLGCGPATQLCLVAELNPAIKFLGIDFSETMLESAREYAASKQLKNVEFQKGDITNLSQLRDNACDGVISTMALHHLPTLGHLEGCFKEISRILSPGGSLYLTDFGRLKYLKSVLYFAYMNRKHQPHIFSLDYERSLRAAFLKQDFQEIKSRHLPSYELLSTFLFPLLIVIKSRDLLLGAKLADDLKKRRTALSPKYRKILDDIRFLFKMGGLKNDPFS